MTYITNKDFMLEVAAGNVAGHASVNKFGHNDSTADGVMEDVWSNGGTYSFPTTADITHLRQAVDQATLRGETVEIQGLDTNFAIVTQNVVLDATLTTTPVALGTALKRVFRMKVMADVVSTQVIELRNVGGATTYAVIEIGDNQTLMAIYTVPASKTAYITSYYGDVVRTTALDPDSVEFSLWFADRNNSYEFQVKHHLAVPKQAPGFQHSFCPYYQVTEKTDIKLSALADATAAAVNGGFDLILVDN